MGSNICIERAKNGYEVEMTDPEIVKANNAPSKNGKYTPYKDPKVSYVFQTKDAMLKFISDNIDKALPMDEYENSFDEAAATEEGED